MALGLGVGVYPRGGGTLWCMSDTFHQYATQALQREQNKALQALVDVTSQQASSIERQAETMRAQADDARASQRRAWWISLSAVIVAAGSLVVAVLALLLG